MSAMATSSYDRNNSMEMTSNNLYNVDFERSQLKYLI